MVTISLCMIVKNEESVLARCLDSVKHVVDEIIIVDTGSEDKTKEIAAKYTSKIFDFEWINDFSAAKNEAFSKATMDYQMWLDADDIVHSAEKLLALKGSLDPAVDIVTMKYVTNTDAYGNPLHTATRERLFRREKNYKWEDPVHECIPPRGKVFHSDIEIHHKREHKAERATRNLNIYVGLEENGHVFTPRQTYYYARELKDHGMWEKSAHYFNKFLDCGKGWVEDNISSCFNLSICYNNMGEQEKVLPALFKSFAYDAPRAEVCSEIGYYYKRKKNYKTALKWFKIAADLGPPDSNGFILWDYWGYLPNIECCVCYSLLGDLDNAEAYNERAASYKPYTAAVEHNRKYLSQVRQGMDF